MSAPRAQNDKRPTIPGSTRLLVALLVVSVAINYVDRGNLSIAAPLLKGEMGISPLQLGILLSSFFWTYSVFNLISGWVVDRFDVNWALAAGFLLWSGITAATGFVGGFATFLVFRMLVGVGESVAYPAYSKILSAHLEERQRGVANALIDSGTKLGPALGTFAGGLLVAHYGWRPFFIALGLGGLLWLPFWFKFMPDGMKPVQSGAPNAPGLGEILRHRAIWAAFVGHFSGNYLWYFLLTWLPYYLVHERHLSMVDMATVGSLPTLFTAGATIAAGWLSYRALAAGATPTRVRKTCTILVGIRGGRHFCPGRFEHDCVHGPAHFREHFLWRFRLEPLGDLPDDRRAARRRQMVRYGEFRGEPGRRGGPRVDGIRGGPHGKFLLGLRRRRGCRADGGDGLPVRPGTRRGGELEHAG